MGRQHSIIGLSRSRDIATKSYIHLPINEEDITMKNIHGRVTIKDDVNKSTAKLTEYMNDMPGTNQTSITTFFLLSFRHLNQLQFLLFLLFLIIYIGTVTGNILILVLVVTDKCLHTPMYFFLANLSFLETFYSSVVTPRILFDCLSDDGSISFGGCISQLFLYTSLAGAECFLLAIMAFDRYLAICKPLHYTVIMNFRVCLQLAVASWVSGILASALSVGTISKLYFCGPNQMDQFVCDMEELMKLSCKKSTWAKMTVFVACSIVTLVPFVFIVISYGCILSAILKIASSAGRQKAFSTCAAHLTVVSLYYGTIIILYVIPKTGQSPEFHKGLSVVYTVVTPMLNPIVYSLRNKEVKGAFNKLFPTSFKNRKGWGFQWGLEEDSTK
uniref:olfactory receptor 10A7-like n=1 Tax=Euleptes europaea TaxID=460621 RepID=UPI00253F6BC4|nr:olfactory receptor 10A7-like [Euleptes europaea]